MNKMKYCLVCIATLLLSTTPAMVSAAETNKPLKEWRIFGKKKKNDKSTTDTVKVLSRYQKLFDKKKNVKTVDGLMKLHNVEGKILVEIPDSLFGAPMIIYSFAEQVSNPDFAFLGRRVGREMKVVFSHTDSLVNILNFIPTAISENPNVAEALKKSNVGAVLFSFPIEARTPDSTAFVFDATKLFLGDNENMTAINSVSGPMGISQKKANYVNGNSFLNELIAYEDHVEVLTTKSYTVQATDMRYARKENPLTVVARTIVAPMPKETMKPRIADTRIGVATVSVTDFAADNGAKSVEYAMRWRLKASDEEAYSRGETVEPENPIVFYVDTLFSKVWQQAIIDGIEKWNDAFEKIGFKNVVKATPYPSDDKQFNAANYRYNCVKYNQTSSRDITTRLTVDYRSGEILAASIGVGRDVEFMSIQPEAMIVQGAYNPSVRGINLPDKELKEAVTAAFMRAAGSCLGFELNYAASAAYSIEQLRSPEFTTEKGFASSVMTPLNYNYLVQPEDYMRGAKVVADKLGPYDYYAVNWLYKPIEGTPEQEKETTSGWINEHTADAEYKYMPLQLFSMLFDPRYASNALSDDPLNALILAKNNQKYVVQNVAEWIDVDGVDEIYKFLLPDFVLLNIFANTPLYGYLGGVTLTHVLEADSRPTYEPLPMSKQKEVLKYILDMSADMSWTDNKHLLACAGINDNMSQLLEFSFVNNVFSRLGSLPALIDAPLKSTENTYKELTTYAASLILTKVSSGKKLSYGEMIQLRRLVAMLRGTLVLKPQYDSSGNVAAITDRQRACLPEALTYQNEECVPPSEGNMMLYNPLRGIKYFSNPALSGFNYDMLEKVVQSVERGARLSADQSQKDALQYLAYTIKKQMEGE